MGSLRSSPRLLQTDWFARPHHCWNMQRFPRYVWRGYSRWFQKVLCLFGGFEGGPTLAPRDLCSKEMFQQTTQGEWTNVSPVFGRNIWSSMGRYQRWTMLGAKCIYCSALGPNRATIYRDFAIWSRNAGKNPAKRCISQCEVGNFQGLHRWNSAFALQIRILQFRRRKLRSFYFVGASSLSLSAMVRGQGQITIIEVIYHPSFQHHDLAWLWVD